MKFKGTNNKVASAALSLLSGCVGKVCVGAGGPPATGLGQGVPARPAEWSQVSGCEMLAGPRWLVVGGGWP